MRSPVKLSMCLLALLAMWPAPMLRATVYVVADLRALTTESGAVAHGRVVAVESQWVEGRRAIETLVTLQVESYAKGDLGQSVTLRVPGGKLGPYRSVMLGAPTFAEGDEVVVFLAATGPAIPHLVGLGQGVFRVRTDGARGHRTVTPEIVRLPGAGALEPARVVRGDGTRRPAPLAAFLDEVRALAGGKQ